MKAGTTKGGRSHEFFIQFFIKKKVLIEKKQTGRTPTKSPPP
jgi:hypothetical protein